MAKFGKIKVFTKIALVYLCLCQTFNQIEDPSFGLNFGQNGQNVPENGQIWQKNIISLKLHQFTCVYVKFSAKSKNPGFGLNFGQNGQNGPKMAKFGKTKYFTKIALVYLCLCQIFSQIEGPKFWTQFWPKWPKRAQNGQIWQKKLFH